MAKSAEALINPSLLIWARSEAHLSAEEAAKKTSVSKEKLLTWESGGARPTIKQLRKLAHIYRQSFAAFYLPEPPVTRKPDAYDYRRIAGASFEEIPPAIASEFRNAMERRDVALEILNSENTEIPDFHGSVTLSESPESVGAKIRALLSISLEDQFKFIDERDAFNSWRKAIEEAGVLVFQASSVPVDEMRGFSLSEHPLPVIVANRKDALTARCFTLIHELAHIMLHSSQTYLFNNSANIPPEYQKLEVFCNKVAANTLVPQDALLQESTKIANRSSLFWSDKALKELSAKFSVSRENILRRLLDLKLTDQEFYEDKRRELNAQLQATLKEKKKKSTGGFVTPSQDVISLAGKPFVRLVLDAFHTNRITANDVSDYLGIRLKHLDKIIQSVA